MFPIGGPVEQRINIDKIKLHPMNSNTMSSEDIGRLKELIRQEGNYPALIVNKINEEDYRLLDGHQRLKALRDLHASDVKCDVWEVDNETELILLSTLNTLKGREVQEKREMLLKRMSEIFDRDRLMRITNERKETLDRVYDNVKEKRQINTEVNKGDSKIAFIQRLDPEQYKFVMDFVRENYSEIDDKNAVIFHIIKDLCEYVKDVKTPTK